MQLEKKIIVITGAAGGIGQACAQVFKGHSLVITDYSQDQVDETVAFLLKEGFDVSGICCDITQENDVEKLVKFVADRGSFKALVHTAGISGTVNDLKLVYMVDLVGTELLINGFYKLAEKGSVAILLSSMVAHTVAANPEYDEALSHPQVSGSFEVVSKFAEGSSDKMYNFAKRGVHLLTHKNATKWGGKGARIVSVSPGVIETPMALKAAAEHPERMAMIKQATPLKRNGQPEEIAGVVYFLTTEAAHFITGTDILVDGGVTKVIKEM